MEVSAIEVNANLFELDFDNCASGRNLNIISFAPARGTCGSASTYPQKILSPKNQAAILAVFEFIDGQLTRRRSAVSEKPPTIIRRAGFAEKWLLHSAPYAEAAKTPRIVTTG